MSAPANDVARRYEMVRQQVISKIRWGAEDVEVLAWLAKKCGITGGAADALLEEAHAAKRVAVRKRAILWLIFSGLGLIPPAAYFGAQLMLGGLDIGRNSAVIGAFGLTCLATFLRSLWQLLTGKLTGAVDD